MDVPLFSPNDCCRIQKLSEYADPEVIVVAQKGFNSLRRKFSAFLVYFTYLLIVTLACTLVEMAGHALWKNIAVEFQLHAFNKKQLLEGMQQIVWRSGVANEKEKQD